MYNNKIIAVLDKYSDKLTEATLIEEQQAKTCYCVVGACLHEAGVPDEDLRYVVTNLGSDGRTVWERWKALLRNEYDMVEEDIHDLISVNDSPLKGGSQDICQTLKAFLS